MAIDSSQITPQKAYERITQLLRASRQHLIATRAVFTQPTITADNTIALLSHLQDIPFRVDNAMTVPGLDAYAKSVKGATYDIAAEWATVKTAMFAARDEILGIIPADVNGFRLILKLTALGLPDWRTFTSTQAAPIVTRIDAITVAITDGGQVLL